MTTFNQLSNTIATDTVAETRRKAFTRRSQQRGLPMALLSNVPPKAEVHRFVDELIEFLFPVNCRQIHKASGRYAALQDHLKQLLGPLPVDAAAVADTFFAALPDLLDRMLEDAHAALASDPAATGLEEVIIAYPGFYATAVYRLAHQLLGQGVPLLPRMLTEYAHGQTGIDIHPAAQIGRAFVIDHGTGTIIGATARIGHHVQLYHGVTLGALQVNKSLAGTKRHPTIEDHVTIYANATILGGETVIGHHSIIGGNVWLTDSVPPHSQVYHEGQVRIRTQPQN
ncbi:MAG: serine acetyltransferase [Anaerolineales bacterium]|nr:serine acetyltransferase [Anaerolineales bacterium]